MKIRCASKCAKCAALLRNYYNISLTIKFLEYAKDNSNEENSKRTPVGG